MKLPCEPWLLSTWIGVVTASNRYMHEAMTKERAIGYGTDSDPSWKPTFVDESPPHKGFRVTREDWVLWCSSENDEKDGRGRKKFPCKFAIDGKNGTSWRSDIGDGTHSIIVDLILPHMMNAVVILPPIDTGVEDLILHHEIYVSNDNENWNSPVAFGMWPNTKRQRMSIFEPVPARYMKLITRGDKDTSIAISELNIYATAYTIPKDSAGGVWGPTIDFPVVPVAGAQEASGQIVVWSSFAADEYYSLPGQKTAMSRWNSNTINVSKRIVAETSHDMFCPGISMDGTGMMVVSGGNSASDTSLYDGRTEENKWVKGPQMRLGRGYHSSTTISDGRVFLVGGSWSGGSNIPKNGEVYDPYTRNWTSLPGAKMEPMLTNDKEGQRRADNHPWLFGWKENTVFQAGPSVAMNWYSVEGEGNVTGAGNRLNDKDSMSGNAVMFDAVNGKILTFGGSRYYDKSVATANAHIITLGKPGQNPTVELAGVGGKMHFTRVFHTSVVLPDGKVFIAGGQDFGIPFDENNVRFVPELYDPEENTFTKLQQNNVVRVYHSLSILLPDARVLNGGGGLCGNCSSNHYDAQIFTPPYLLTKNGALRRQPQIVSLSSEKVQVGAELTITTDAWINTASLIRLSSATHTVNTDQRRIPLELVHLKKPKGGYEYQFTLPDDAGIIIPGYWMLFVMDGQGVPSKAKTIMVTVHNTETADPLEELYDHSDEQGKHGSFKSS